MKKSNLKSLRLNKKSISSFSKSSINGGHTNTLWCPLPPDKNFTENTNCCQPNE